MEKKRKSTLIPKRILDIEAMIGHTSIESIVDFNNITDQTVYNKKSDDIRELIPKKYLDFTTAINQLGGKLLYFKSGSTGHTFKGVYPKDEKIKKSYAVKVVAYPKKENYGSMYNIKRPENAELIMIRLLSFFVINKETPHIVLPITTFNTSIKPFLSLSKQDIVNNKRYDMFLKRNRKGEYYSNVSVLISEWANGGDFLDYIKKNYKDLKNKQWRCICFQILSVLAIIQSKYPGFRHNDLKANNILIHTIPIELNDEKHKYIINGQSYVIPNIGFQLKLWDFDFATIPGLIDNAKVEAEWTNKINIKPVKNRYYDLHYFFNTLTKKGFFPEFWEESCIPEKVKEFVNRIIPKKFKDGNLVSERGRILIDEEYLTPDEILKNDPYFKSYHVE
jgi:serine/threonine protein kinase